MNKVEYIEEINTYVFPCPHCQCLVLVGKSDINCQIFRHAIYKENGQQTSPHLPKDECEKLVSEEKIHGCGKPFRFDGSIVDVCDYI